jgi:hypothetical protein
MDENGKNDYAHDDTRCDALIFLLSSGLRERFAACLSSLCDQALQIPSSPEHRRGPSLKTGTSLLEALPAIPDSCRRLGRLFAFELYLSRSYLYVLVIRRLV